MLKLVFFATKFAVLTNVSWHIDEELVEYKKTKGNKKYSFWVQEIEYASTFKRRKFIWKFVEIWGQVSIFFVSTFILPGINNLPRSLKTWSVFFPSNKMCKMKSLL
jgi:hypothetical protein